MSQVASSGGGGGKKPRRCLGGPGMGCDCPDCRGWRLKQVDLLRERRIGRRKKLAEREKEFEETRPQRVRKSHSPDGRLKTVARLVMGKAPEIRPLVFPRSDSPPNFFKREYYEGEGESRWVIGQEPADARPGWREVLEIDEFDAGYINRLYRESDHSFNLADLMDTFCRDRLRLCDVLTILGNTCVFLRLVGNRTTARDLIVTRQLDRAYMIEHPDLILAEHPLNDDAEEIENVNAGIALKDDPDILKEFEPDDEDND